MRVVEIDNAAEMPKLTTVLCYGLLQIFKD
jgi:hypothetical protein